MQELQETTHAKSYNVDTSNIFSCMKQFVSFDSGIRFSNWIKESQSGIRGGGRPEILVWQTLVTISNIGVADYGR